MKASRKRTKKGDWPKKVSFGRFSVSVYRRKLTNGRYGFQLANYASGKRRLDSYPTEGKVIEAAQENATLDLKPRITPTVVNNVPILDSKVIDNLRDLTEPDEDDPVIELVELFLDDAPQRIHQIRAQLQQRDQELARIAAHSLKGSARNLGALALSHAAEQVEDHIKADDWDGAEAGIEQIQSELESLIKELESKNLLASSRDNS